MFRHSWAIAASLAIVFGFITHAPAQSPAAGSPSTAYRKNGKWVGYVPPHQKYSRASTGRLFRQSPPNIASCLASEARSDGAAGSSVQPAGHFEGALLDSDDSMTEPQVLPVAYDEPTPAFSPDVEMIGDSYSPGCGSCGSCDSGVPCAAAPACAPPRLYGSADYLLWWTDSMGTPPLVTTSPAGTAQGQAGVLGQADTTVLFGGSDLQGDAGSGGRFSLGLWLDPCRSQGLEVSYFTLGSQSESFTASNADYTILARPFYNTVDGLQDARLIAYDGLVSGSLTATASTSFEGGEFLLRHSIQRECWVELDFIAGYRWLQLEDGLLIDETTQSLSGATAGTSFELFDRFDTRNSFHGGELGMSIRRQIDPCWSIELLGKLAIGNVNSVTTIDGQTTTIASTGTTVTQGGLLTQATNIGRYERDKLATATELGLTLKRSLGDRMSLTFGYTFLYLSDVARAGDQIDPNINVSQLPPGSLVGAAFPEFSFQSTGFWAQGLNFGLEGRF